MEAYCVKCKEKRDIQDPEAVYTATGSPGTRGLCPVCGTKMFRMGRTDAHADIPAPEKTARKRKKKTQPRNGKLVIVESPAKARTVERILGKGFTVKASVGHVRDLLRSQLSVDVENSFAPKYRVPNEKRPIVKELKSVAKESEVVYLATDPDREGEAIAWHLIEAAEIDPEIAHRVVFHEITRPAVEAAFENPRLLNMNLVDAQQARRVLDRLVGYSLSPILWRKVRNRLSAGRVQSVALRLVVEREREIENFEPTEYWTVEAELRPEEIQETYRAKLLRRNGEELELKNEDDVRPILLELDKAVYTIEKIKRGTRRRKPSAPFTTSTLQQEASRRLGLTARRTMALAQQLYEGVDLGDGDNRGLITYMRTDSTTVSQIAQQEASEYIRKHHGDSFVPDDPPKYRTSARKAQEAHEAIRPTSVARTPNEVKSLLTRDQYRMYQLIWKRFVASQMETALFDTISVDVNGRIAENEYLLRASGSTLRFPGFLVVYQESKRADQNGENGNGVTIPEGLYEGQTQHLIQILPDQHFTQPPARYSEASLVRALEEHGIGRPSTYAPILSTLQNRSYVYREDKRLHPTDVGMTVNDLLVDYFPDIVDVDFTARMETNLDDIASGETPWVDVVNDFYGPFSERVDIADKEMPEVKTEPELVGRTCPQCGHDLIIRWGRFGKFISCSDFPNCRHTEQWLEKIGVSCPLDSGDVVERRTRKGRIFYGCENYPECEYTSWKRPLATPCPVCAGTLVIFNKNHAQCSQCEERFPLDDVTKETQPE